MASWLRKRTHFDEPYWMARVQQLIADKTSAPDETGHGETDLVWLHELVDEVANNLPPQNQGYDGNMRMAATLSMILGLWFSQVQWAKTFDPARPTFMRQEGYMNRLEWILEMQRIFHDQSPAPIYFPGQKWQNPFEPGAKGGDFV